MQNICGRIKPITSKPSGADDQLLQMDTFWVGLLKYWCGNEAAGGVPTQNATPRSPAWHWRASGQIRLTRGRGGEHMEGPVQWPPAGRRRGGEGERGGGGWCRGINRVTSKALKRRVCLSVCVSVRACLRHHFRQQGWHNATTVAFSPARELGKKKSQLCKEKFGTLHKLHNSSITVVSLHRQRLKQPRSKISREKWKVSSPLMTSTQAHTKTHTYIYTQRLRRQQQCRYAS